MLKGATPAVLIMVLGLIEVFTFFDAIGMWSLLVYGVVVFGSLLLPEEWILRERWVNHKKKWPAWVVITIIAGIVVFPVLYPRWEGISKDLSDEDTVIIKERDRWLMRDCIRVIMRDPGLTVRSCYRNP